MLNNGGHNASIEHSHCFQDQFHDFDRPFSETRNTKMQNCRSSTAVTCEEVGAWTRRSRRFALVWLFALDVIAFKLEAKVCDNSPLPSQIYLSALPAPRCLEYIHSTWSVVYCGNFSHEICLAALELPMAVSRKNTPSPLRRVCHRAIRSSLSLC